MLNNYDIIILSYVDYPSFNRDRRKFCKFEEIILEIKRMIFERQSSNIYLVTLKLFFKFFDKIDINLIIIFILIENKSKYSLIMVTNRSLDIIGELVKWH